MIDAINMRALVVRTIGEITGQTTINRATTMRETGITLQIGTKM